MQILSKILGLTKGRDCFLKGAVGFRRVPVCRSGPGSVQHALTVREKDEELGPFVHPELIGDGLTCLCDGQDIGLKELVDLVTQGLPFNVGECRLKCRQRRNAFCETLKRVVPLRAGACEVCFPLFRFGLFL